MSSYLQGKKYYDSLPDETKKIVDKVILTTFDSCMELFERPFPFFETEAYKAMKFEILGHVAENENYDYVDKVWVNFDEEAKKKNGSK